MAFDVLIVGSGACGVNAAAPLVEAGFSVGILDVGHDDEVYGPIIPEASFLDVRRTCDQQHRFFLGDHFEGVPMGRLGVGPQLTPPRQFITKDVDELAPIDTNGFFALTSLALGGLTRGWGAGAFQYSAADMRDYPISRDDLVPHYEKVAERIGISGDRDDLLPYEGELKAMLPPLELDRNAATILEKYNRHRRELNAAGLFIGKPRLAALSRAYRGRGPEQYRDMSFWTDADQSVWRPFHTLNELKRFPNFTYLRPYMVQSFREKSDGTVQVFSINRDTKLVETHEARKLVLAASVFGTARIVLKSLHQYETRIPVACDPYTYYPMLNLNMLGKAPSDHSHSLAQLCVVYDPDGTGAQTVHGRVHLYRSLLNFKLIKMMPLPHREAMRVAQLLAPNLAILALDHEDRPSPEKYCVLHASEEGKPDRLEVIYSMPEEVRKDQIRKERVVTGHFRKLGCIALKRVWSGFGISLHYGATFPMTRDDRPLTTDTTGLLRQTRSVYIGDSSVLPYVPAKGMTFTAMAIANRVGERLCNDLRRS